MTKAQIVEGFRIEVLQDEAWDDVAEAKSLESAMLRARNLFRYDTVTQVRVVETLASGRRRIHEIQRSMPKPEEQPGLGVQAIRAANAVIGAGAEAQMGGAVALSTWDDLVAQVKRVFARILLVAAIGAGFGTFGVLMLQIFVLLSSIRVF